MKKEDYNRGIKRIQELTGTNDNFNETFKLNIKRHNISTDEAIELRQKLIDEYSREEINYRELEQRLSELIQEYSEREVIETKTNNDIEISFNQDKNRKEHITRVNTVNKLIKDAVLIPFAALKVINDTILPEDSNKK